MKSTVSRRDFLKLAGLSLAGLAMRPLLPTWLQEDPGDVVRVAISTVSVYSQPSDQSRILYQRFRDDLVHIYDEIVSPDGPGYNPIWYRVWGGYIHSGHVVRVKTHLNPVIAVSKDNPRIAEVTVPYTQAMMKRGSPGWQPVYRLYYQSVHWVTATEDGPDGKPWYRLMDELLNIEYHAPAEHLRLVPNEELTPIHPDVPHAQKRIDVSIARQMVTAYEGDQVVLQTKVSTGIQNRFIDPGITPTETPKGEFRVQSKMPSKHMGDGNLTADIEAYELPGVPWVTFFETTVGIAFHGTWWHTNYGIPMSRGCVNMRNEDAKWLFRWAAPYSDPVKENTIGYGTLVVVG